MAITPRGRPIYSSGSILDFVAGIRDAIKGHEGLVGKGILHGDISEGNIILLKPTSDGDLHGMLIDLDQSFKMKRNPVEENVGFSIGTVKFMALERLRSVAKSNFPIRRTCRHDLESLFYVFIVGCIEYEFVNDRKSKNLNDWCKKSLLNCYYRKLSEITPLSPLLDQFTPSFEGLKELALKLRTILFHKHKIYTETPLDCGSMCREMILAFDKTVKDIRGKIYLLSHESIALSSSSVADNLNTFSWKNQEQNIHITSKLDHDIVTGSYLVIIRLLPNK
ncbi:Bgt-50996 [Blumeria graminis f. sp. tritici]|uniref:Bgt-50996 n=1 Tax=Blumeria graminis f. sp. tritici TaxID=62690 RepID=A0A9X9LAK4_BLUGR|nr:Bgt-50996 [Blumeria graminis f. sp. tritici]